VLEVQDLAVSYGAVKAVRGIDIQVGDGEAVALLGPNGAGKTSTLRAITDLAPYTGRITFDGMDCHKVGTERLAQAGLIHVPEGRHVFPTLSVHENLQMGLRARGGRTDGYTIDEVYELFPPLVNMRGREGWALSGGEQQMVAVGRALVAAPRLLLLDEPSLGLAPIVVKAVYAALNRVAARTPILLVEQNTVTALSLSKRGYVLAEGRIVLAGSAVELSDRKALLDSYLGQEAVAH
jgi:branched-chain amino acid transport system ATP-binding protein